MSKVSKGLAIQAMILAGASLIVRFIGFLYRLPVTTMIGDEGNGIYAASYNLYALFLVISSSALPATISKLVAESDSKGHYRNSYKIFRVGMFVSGVMGFCSMILLLLLANSIETWVNIEGSAISIRLLAPTVFLVSILSIYRGYYQGMKDNKPTAMSQVYEQIFNAIMSILLTYILVKKSIAWGAGGSSIGTGIGALAGLIYISRLHKKNKGWISKRAKEGTKKLLDTKAIAKAIIFTAIPITLGTSVFSIVNIIDMKMITEGLLVNFSSQEATSLYGQYTGKYILLTTLPVSIATAFSVTIIPNIAIAKKMKDNKDVELKSNTALKITMLFCVPAAIGLSVLAGPILQLLFRGESNGDILLRYGSFSIIFIALSQVCTGILQGLSFAYVPVFAALISAVFKITINYNLIRIEEINILGAVFATITFYAITSAINYTYLRKKCRVRLNLISAIGKPLFASIIMGIICKVIHIASYSLFSSNDISTILAIAIGGISYFGVMFLIGGLEREVLLKIPYIKNYVK